MKHTLVNSVEFKILLLGVFLTVLLLGYLGYCAVTDLKQAETLVLVFGAHTFGGRAAGVGLCIFAGMGPALSIGYNFYIEVLIVCFTYSGFVLSTKSYLRVPWIMNAMDRLTEKALERKHKIEPYGWIGIFLFVMAPLPVTGPVMGSIIGYMLRLGLIRNLSATLLGTLTAIAIWFYCFDFLNDRFHIIQYVFIAIVVVVVVPHLKKIKNFILSLKG
ncbi:small multi-drug export protein [Desulfoluna spongiiphila]|uniref:Putative small multi-drug export protein n=1 Tax=Desulfoluna spongiiphila TaxID=419481 RepID=A0A1G5F694_9BACT|nr:small multi-drug export protein [Desulfoluna spongiiphila]SCY34752.1 Putative small multi-drug export protein [Desulfoluna spongiiphila]VVS94274.1 putative small multi-drug export [Desulfoluna spongiiphila]